MANYETVSFENRTYLGRWISVHGKSYLLVDDSIAEKIKGRRLSKKALKKLPDLSVLLYSSVEMLFESEDVLNNFAEMQLLESEYQKKYA